jgi:hypothetical protein
VAEVSVTVVGLTLDTVGELVNGRRDGLGLGVGGGWAVGWCGGGDNNTGWGRGRGSDNDWSRSCDSDWLRTEEDWSGGSPEDGKGLKERCVGYNVSVAVSMTSVGDDGSDETRKNDECLGRKKIE